MVGGIMRKRTNDLLDLMSDLYCKINTPSPNQISILTEQSPIANSIEDSLIFFFRNKNHPLWGCSCTIRI